MISTQLNIIVYWDYKRTEKTKFRDQVSNFAFDQFGVSHFKETMADELLECV